MRGRPRRVSCSPPVVYGRAHALGCLGVGFVKLGICNLYDLVGLSWCCAARAAVWAPLCAPWKSPVRWEEPGVRSLGTRAVLPGPGAEVQVSARRGPWRETLQFTVLSLHPPLS